MKQALDLQLPQGLVDALREVNARPGEAISIERQYVVAVDKVLHSVITEGLADVRERERVPSAEVVKLRFR